MRRVFLADLIGDPSLPELPGDLRSVVDKAGVIWHRMPRPTPNAGCYVPDDNIGDLDLPDMLSWSQLLITRGPVAELRSEQVS
jgi:hypothetical protein